MPQIFICYAHKDNEGSDPSKKWLDRLLEHLAPLELQDKADIWSDQKIELGVEWHDKIQTTLQQVKVAVLLVSPSFLASKYIRNNELPVLLKNAKDKGVIILPVLLRQCLWKETTFKFPDPKEGPEELSLSSLQMPTSDPLNSLEEYKQDEALYKISQKIHKIVTTNSNMSNFNLSYPSEPISIELKSAKGIDYTQLNNLLQIQKWKEADEETASIMYQIINSDRIKESSIENIKTFPCEDLKTINKLWVTYSNEKFGFSVQAKIYIDDLGATKQYDEKIWQQFGDRVGWRQDGYWINDLNPTVESLDTKPVGYFPHSFFKDGEDRCWLILFRMKACKP
ncbi:GUN4 domain-containing protein [Cyanothece sp. BG0011]